MAARCTACGVRLAETATCCPQCGRCRAAPSAADEVLWEGTFSARTLLRSWLAMGSATAVAIAITGATMPWHRGLLVSLLVAALCFGSLGLYALYRKLTVRYRLTSRRLVHEEGLLRRVTEQIDMSDVEDVACSQRRIERITGVGTIKIMFRDPSHPDLYLEGVARVRQVARLIDDVQRTERMQRGPFREPS